MARLVPGRMRELVRSALTGSLGAAAVALATACDGPTRPTPTDPPAISCPASMTVRGVPGGSQPVTFPAPGVIGGAAPVAVTCAPASGSSFTLGTTPITCGATDGMGRQSQCSFSVTLTPLLLSITKFVAFGDSLTEGENGRLAILGSGFIDPAATYPVRLQSLLNAEYPGQGIVVVNRGWSGEPVERAVERLPGVLAQDRAGALLLLDGYNNLLGNCPFPNAGSAACAAAIDEVIARLRDCVRIAQNPTYGLKYVFVSTLTPPGPFAGGPKDRRIAPDAILQTNARLSAMVRAEGAILVDAYPVFLGHESEYVDQDGLHLRPAGYEALAGAFFAAIKTAVSSTPAFGGGP